jgi:deoxyribodipyrimidine photo-lyase
MWFRRDLRLADHPALLAASGARHPADGPGRRPVLPLFIVDPALHRSAGPVRRQRLGESLAALDESLRAMGGRLAVRTGDPATVLRELVDRTGADEVLISADFGPYGAARDAAVSAMLPVPLRAVGSPYAVAPGLVRKGDGSPYRVYTPFSRAWAAHGWPAPAPDAADAMEWAADAASEPLPTEGAADTAAEAGLLPPAGEAAAMTRWAEFRDGPLASYADARNRPDLHGTSALSAALKWGELHPRTLLADLGDNPGHDTFRRELAWREFYADVLHHHPTSAWRSLRADIGAMRVDTGDEADARFEAWCAGRTGYPFVDAGMRQLLADGWMHNRVRMVVASFLVKDLHLPWQRGARWFMRHLRDADLASNSHGWQWTAGTGTDAAPYFRIFNPVAQGLRFDPDGDYVRRYVPELRGLPGAAAHEPWAAAAEAAGYPARIVDHGDERAEALARLADATAPRD